MITAIRSDYPSRAFAIFGPSRPQDREFDDLCARGQAIVIREDLWRRLEASRGAPQQLNVLLASLSDTQLQGVVSFDDDDTRRVLLLNEQIGFQSSALRDASMAALNKAVVYSALRDVGVFMPEFFVADGVAALSTALGNLNRPLSEFIIKPCIGTASRGVYRPSFEDIPEVVAQRVADLSLGASSFLVMPFLSAAVDGVEEFCADGVVVAGEVASLTLMEKVRQDLQSGFADRLMVTPPTTASLSAVGGQVAAITQTALAALGYRHGVFHIEFRFLDDGTPVPIDIALRPGGGLVAEAVRASAGIDLRICHVAAMLGDCEWLEDIVRTAHPTASAVAIGAYYSPPESRPDAKSVERTIATLRERPDVLAYHVGCELTDRHWAQPNMGVSIAIGAKSASKAIETIDDLTRSLSLQ